MIVIESLVFAVMSYKLIQLMVNVMSMAAMHDHRHGDIDCKNGG